MKFRNLLWLLLCFLAPAVAFGKAAFWKKSEMIRRAEIVAVVSITKAEPTKEKRTGWTYSQVATAKVEKVLKGELPNEVRL